MNDATGHHHNYSVVRDDAGATVEVCGECGKKLVTKKYSGRIDNEAYRKEHIRDFAQPGGATDKVFQKYYGDKLKKR